LNKETVVARSREDKARVSDSSLKGLGVDTGDAKGKNICSVGDTTNFEARVSLKGGDDFLGCGDGLGVTLGEALEEMERDGSEGPHLAKSIAEHAARMKQIFEEALRAARTAPLAALKYLYMET
jgi:hypothetical protein